MEKLVEITLEPPSAWEVVLPAGTGTREKCKGFLPHRPVNYWEREKLRRPFFAVTDWKI